MTQQFYFIPVAAKEPISPPVAPPSAEPEPPVVDEELKQKVQAEKKRKAEVVLRSQPLDELTSDQVKKMLVDKGLFATKWNKIGNGIKHQYRAITRRGEALVIDDATSLMWQQSGSSDTMTYAKAELYIQNLNNEKFAGYSDWRIPTFEEAMSLMEPAEKNGDLYIDPVFGKRQQWIWTADKKRVGMAWLVSFSSGYCYYSNVDRSSIHIRAVRSG